jgi:hypothetical protein
MPEPDRSGEGVHLYCAHLAAVDAALAVALRATIEHDAKAIGIPVSLDAPAEPGCCARLQHFLGDALLESFEIRGASGAGPLRSGALS